MYTMVMTDFSPFFFVQLCNYLKSANHKVPDDCHLSDSLFFTAIIMWWTLHLSNYSPPSRIIHISSISNNVANFEDTQR